MKFDHLQKAQDRESIRHEEYRNWRNPTGYKSFYVPAQGSCSISKKINRVQEEIKITNYPKRIKKLKKILSSYKSEHPELFV